MAEYLSLQSLYYRDTSSERDAVLQREATRRRNDASSFKTEIRIATGEIFLAMPTELSLLSERLLRIERKVSQLWRALPPLAHWAYHRGLILDEVMSTNEIEGVHSTRRQVEEALDSIRSKKPSCEHKRFKEFARLYLELRNKESIYPKTPADIRKIYDAITAGELEEDDQPDGVLFRKGSTSVVSSTQEEVHRGVGSEPEITKMLEQMIALVSSSSIPSTFSAIIAHFLFEYIHPFYDGNGRTGRYLLALYLSEPLSLPTVLTLSKIIADNKRAYYKAFSSTEAPLNHAEITFFVIQMMEFIRLAQDSVRESLEHKVELSQRIVGSLENTITDCFGLSRNEGDVLLQATQIYLFGSSKDTLIEDIIRHTDISWQTARKHTHSLEKKGLLETTARKPLRFALTKKALRAFGIDEA